MAPKSVSGKVGGASRGCAPANHKHGTTGMKSKALDINAIAAEFAELRGEASSSSPVTSPHWSQAVDMESPVLTKMNCGRKLTAEEICDAAARVKMYLNPGDNGGWEAETYLLDELAAHSALLRVCAGIEVFVPNPKVAAHVLGVVAKYPGYDLLKEDMATAYAALQLEAPEEDADYQFLRDLVCIPPLIKKMKQLRQERMSKFSSISESTMALMEDCRNLQRAYQKCVDADVAAIAAVREAQKRLTDAKAQRIEELRGAKAKLVDLQALTSSTLSPDELAHARKVYRNTVSLREACSEECFIETLRMKKIDGNAAANRGSLANLESDAIVAVLTAKTLEARQKVEEIMQQLHSGY
eukprot:jgi/Botrbrau1/13224/Bobra.9_1s0013.1